MALTQPSTTTTTISAPDTGKNYRAPLAMVTTLFFMWGFLTCLNDILIPHLKAIFDLNYAQVMLVQLAFFGAYAVFSIPSGFIIERIGYQRMMVAGLLTMGLGAALFVPAATAPSFPLFLAALIILAAGITALAGFRQSLRCIARPGENRLQPSDLDASIQLFRHIHRAIVWRHPDPRHRSQDCGRDRCHEPDGAARLSR